MNDPEYYLFPVRNEKGFRVTDSDTYVHMIHTIIEASAELQQDYPDKKILVVYTV